MRLDQLEQVARVAIVMPSAARLGSVGALVDGFDRARAWVRRQYGAIDALPAVDRFDVAELVLLSTAPGGATATEGGTRLVAAGPLDGDDYHLVAVADHAFGAAGTEEVARLALWLCAQAERGATIAACGASVALLAASGLLDNRRATGPWPMAGLLRAAHPAVRFAFDARVAEDGPLLTSAGAAADLDLAVRLVEAVTSRTVGSWLGRVLSRSDAVVGEGETDPLLARAQHWLSSRFSQPVRIEELSAAMGVSRRTLHRHFVAGTGLTPIGYLQDIRIRAAQRMLERTAFSVDRIAALVGYGDTGFFREAFRRGAGLSPRQWRTERASRRRPGDRESGSPL